MLVAGRNEDEKQWKPIVKGKAVDWSMKRNESVHALLLALVGGYVLYLAYQLFDKLRMGAEEMPLWLAVAAIVLFVLAGLGVLVYAWHIWQESKREAQNPDEDDLK